MIAIFIMLAGFSVLSLGIHYEIQAEREHRKTLKKMEDFFEGMK